MTITFEIQAKIYRSPVNINEKRVTKSDAKNSDVFEDEVRVPKIEEL